MVLKASFLVIKAHVPRGFPLPAARKVREADRDSWQPRPGAHLDQSCRAPEFDHANEHAPLHASNERFQQEGREFTGGSLTAFRTLQFRADAQDATYDARYGG